MAEEERSAGGASADPAGMSLALAGASRGEADAYLRDQRHHLHEDLKQLGLKLWELRLGVLLRLATAVIGLGIAAALALMVWDAAHSHGLIIEPFSVPPALRERGLDGEVIASQLIDRLTHMTKSESSRAVQSYANNWGNNIKVEIPETGVSIGELRNFLRDWLGHDIRISGEVYKTADGIAVTARTSGEEGATFTSKEDDLDTLVQQAAEHVYEVTQPYRYANYLDRNYNPKGAVQRVARATAIYRRLIAGDDALERAWAWNGLATIAFRWHYNNRLSAWYYRKALQQVPDFTIGYFALASRYMPMGSEEEALHDFRQASLLLHRATIPDLNPHYVPNARLSADATVADLAGDFAAEIPLRHQGAELPDDFSVLARGNFIGLGMIAAIRRHDPRAAQAWMRELRWKSIPPGLYNLRWWLDQERQDWRDTEDLEQMGRRGLITSAGDGFLPGMPAYDQGRAYFARAYAQTGDFATAETLIAPTPGDDDQAVRTHAVIAELQGQRARADWWFARSEAQTPSIPFTDALWGQALLARGQPDAAIVKFELSNRKGPHFADPLEGWGEALMAKRESHLALAKFAEAEKYTPNWGRLHLKWGEALVYAGKPDAAKAQFARAAILDLTPSEKSELAKTHA